MGTISFVCSQLPDYFCLWINIHVCWWLTAQPVSLLGCWQLTAPRYSFYRLGAPAHLHNVANLSIDMTLCFMEITSRVGVWLSDSRPSHVVLLDMICEESCSLKTSGTELLSTWESFCAASRLSASWITSDKAISDCVSSCFWVALLYGSRTPGNHTVLTQEKFWSSSWWQDAGVPPYTQQWTHCVLVLMHFCKCLCLCLCLSTNKSCRTCAYACTLMLD